MAKIISLDHCYGYSAGKKGGETGIIVVRVIGEEAEILTLCVPPASRRTGIGGALVAAAMAEQQAAQAGGWFLEVRADNKAAIKLYESLGFEAVGKRPGYYRDAEGGRPDALTMRVGAMRARHVREAM